MMILFFNDNNYNNNNNNNNNDNDNDNINNNNPINKKRDIMCMWSLKPLCARVECVCHVPAIISARSLVCNIFQTREAKCEFVKVCR